MEMPIQLQAAIARLAPEDSDELTAIFSKLPSDDLEIRHLIEENLDALANLLCSQASDSSESMS